MEIKFDIQTALDYGNNKKYYVYRLVDPRTFQTFYIGKGCGNRVVQHVENVKSLENPDEDELSLKSRQIAEILATGKSVIAIIHRRGLSQKEAFEVESALIDAYPALTNIQKGHDFERGAISLEDLYESAKIVEYSEPQENYIIIKTSFNIINTFGSLYEATRICWRAKLEKAKKYNYVFSVINGIVREVYKVSKWYQYNEDRIAFEGVPANDHMAEFKNKLIPLKYRTKGASNPFLYKKR